MQLNTNTLFSSHSEYYYCLPRLFLYLLLILILILACFWSFIVYQLSVYLNAAARKQKDVELSFRQCASNKQLQ
jgi:uncharacterized membrane protein (UPF0182 family)